MQLIEMKLGMAAWKLTPKSPYHQFEIFLWQLNLPTEPTDNSQGRGTFFTRGAHPDPEDWPAKGLPGRAALFIRLNRGFVLELPMVEFKTVDWPPLCRCDWADFSVHPLKVDFYQWHPITTGVGRWQCHEWDGPISELVNMRMEDYVGTARPKKIEVDALKRLLTAGTMLPKGRVRFDGEGGIRPGQN